MEWKDRWKKAPCLSFFCTVTLQSGHHSPVCLLFFAHTFIFSANIYGAFAMCQALGSENFDKVPGVTALGEAGTASTKVLGKEGAQLL